METVLINIIFILLLAFFFVLYKYLTSEKQVPHVQDMKSTQNEYEKVLFGLVHDAKNHIATTSLALHNLEFVINENKNSNSNNPVDEYLSAAKTALSDTTHKIQETVIFSRTGTDKFTAIDIQLLVENIINGLSSSANIVLKCDNNLPFSNIDQQAIELAIGSLVKIALLHQQGNKETHIDLAPDTSNSAIPKILCTIYSQDQSDCAKDADASKFTDFSFMPEPAKFCYMIAQKIIERHGGKISGTYNAAQGMFFYFTLYATGDRT